MTADETELAEEISLWLQNSETPALPAMLRQSLAGLEDQQIQSIVDTLVSDIDLLGADAAKTRSLFQELAVRMVALQQSASADDSAAWPEVSTTLLREAYDQLEVHSPPAAPHVLQMLATQRSSDAMHVLAEALISSPPEDWQAVGLALSPLWKTSPDLLEEFFEALGGEFVHPATMAVLIDLANYCTRTKRLEQHPWSAQRTRLEALLKNVVERLGKLEESPQEFGENVQEIQKTLSDSLALTVSLCDSLGIIGAAESKQVLTTALELSHRRVQTEAAAALTLLKDEVGKKRLLELATDRVARMRAVAYAEELGFVEEIAEEHRTPEAIAESQLAAWLAGSEQFGFPPSEMELLDTKSMFWPSFEEPQNCFLFRFDYQLPEGSMSNIGMAGPCTHSFTTDLGNLPTDDIYAAFAGWHVEHDEIYEVPATQLNRAQRIELEKLSDLLNSEGIEQLAPIALAFFIGEVSLVAVGQRESQQVVAITDGSELLCFQTSPNPKSMSPEVALCIFRGRKMLRTFNS